MQRTEVKKIIKRYANELRRGNFPVSSVYLFGSYAKNRAHKWSDIDIAVVSDKLKRNYEKNRSMLYRTRLLVDDRLEPHGFTKKDFQNLADPMVYEIRETGIKVI